MFVNYASNEQIAKRLDNSDEQTRLLREQVGMMNRILLKMNDRLTVLEDDKDPTIRRNRTA